MNNSFLLALSTLVGTIVGAGMFGLPYVVAKSGIAPGLFWLVSLGGTVLLVHLMFGEVALRTQGKHRLIGYASLYAGDWAKKLVTVSTVVGVVGALLAYIIIAGDFLHLVFGSFVQVPHFPFAVAFWFCCSFFILRGIQTIAKMELVMNVALFAVMAGIFAFALSHVQPANLRLLDRAHVFLPYGVVLFTFWGLSAIPEIAELFKNSAEKRRLDNLIVWSSLLSGTLFLLFTLFVVGVSGQATSQDALSGLVPFLGEKVVVLGAVFGLVAIAASFLVLGNYLKNSLSYDYGIPSGAAAAFALGTPLALFLLNLREFIVVIGVVGALVAAMEGSLVVLVWSRAKTRGERIPEYNLRVPRVLIPALVLLLVLGAVLELFAK